MDTKPKGILGSFFESLFDGSINRAEDSGAPGPAKKQTVLDEILDFFGISGMIRFLVEWLIGRVIDMIVGEKNDSGEFTHGGDA